MITANPKDWLHITTGNEDKTGFLAASEQTKDWFHVKPDSFETHRQIGFWQKNAHPLIQPPGFKAVKKTCKCACR